MNNLRVSRLVQLIRKRKRSQSCYPPLDVSILPAFQAQRALRSYFEGDLAKHFMAHFDMFWDRNHTTGYAALENTEVVGYAFTYTGLGNPPRVLLDSRSPAVAKALLNRVSQKKMVILTDQVLLGLVRARFPESKIYRELRMLCMKSCPDYPDDRIVICELDTQHADAVVALYKFWGNIGPGFNELIRNRRTVGYGAFVGEDLVSAAFALMMMDNGWFLGGIYTRPDAREKGITKAVVSRITNDAIAASGSAILYLREEDHVARELYLRIGYREVGVSLWVDVDSGLEP